MKFNFIQEYTISKTQTKVGPKVKNILKTHKYLGDQKSDQDCHNGLFQKKIPVEDINFFEVDPLEFSTSLH